MVRELLPTPTKSHYTFNLRDLSKVFQGVLQVRYENLPDKAMLISLWVHEAQRIFCDRLVDERDRDWFAAILQEHVGRVFEFEWDRPEIRGVIFGDYANPNKE